MSLRANKMRLICQPLYKPMFQLVRSILNSLRLAKVRKLKLTSLLSTSKYKLHLFMTMMVASL